MIYLKDIISRLTLKDPETVFKTDQGSIYFANEEGVTQRVKSLHTGHSASDVGLKDPSLFTVYLDKKSTLFLAQAAEDGKHMIIFDDYMFTFDVQDRKPIRTSENYSFVRKPQIGLCPYEVFRFEKILDGFRPLYHHFGNAITHLEE